MRLNDALIASEKYRGEPTTDDEGRTQWPARILWDDEIQGFGVRIYPPVRGRPSRKDFIVTWKIGLRTRTMAIGTFGVDCTLRQARRTAREAIDLARRGQDPIEARQRALGIGTTEDLASRFLFEHNAARKKPGIPGGEVASAPDSEPGGDSLAALAPEDLPGETVVAEAADAADAADTADSAEDDSAALSSEPPATEAASSLPTPPVELPVPDLSARELTEPADDPISTAPPAAETAEEPVVESATLDLDSEAEPEHEPEPASRPSPPARPRAAGSPSAPSASMAPAESRVAEPARRPLPPPPAPVKRGPTKVRLLPVPEALYKAIEHGARESEMTIAAYLNALIEITRAAVGDAPAGRPNAGGDAPPHDETGPSVRELFAQVQEAQAVAVGDSDRGDLEGEPG